MIPAGTRFRSGGKMACLLPEREGGIVQKEGYGKVHDAVDGICLSESGGICPQAGEAVVSGLGSGFRPFVSVFHASCGSPGRASAIQSSAIGQ